MEEENQKLINEMNEILKIKIHTHKLHEMFIWDLKAKELSKTVELCNAIKKAREAIIPVVKHMKDNAN